MDSDFVDSTRKSDLKWNTPSSGCYEAPSDFRLYIMGDFSSNGIIPIVVAHNYDVIEWFYKGQVGGSAHKRFFGDFQVRICLCPTCAL
jgi:hypothetical protein